MKRWVFVLLLVGGVWASSSVGPKATAAVEPAAAAVPDVRLGDNVRLCLDRSRSGDVGWLGGVVLAVDASHVKISATINDPTTLSDGSTALVRRPVEQWVPMSSILYVEKLLDGTADPRP